MTSTDFDVVVIGGGPGGSCAAALACRKKLRTLVVEKSAFPRFRIGESLLPMCNDLLREIGAWEKVEAAGFLPKYGALFYVANGSVTKEVDFSTGIVPGLDYTYQVERAKFDALLLDHAQSCGAEIAMRTTVCAVQPRGDRQHITVVSDGEERTVTSRWVVDASGREISYAEKHAQPLDPSPFPKRVAIYNHFRGIPRPAGKAAGSTIVVRLEDGWFWLIPIDAERTSVGLVTTTAAMRSSHLSPAELFHREVLLSPKLSELFAAATATMEFQITSDYSYFRRDLADERLLRIGDAAGFFDPIFSSGVYMAMFSAHEAVAALLRADARNRGLTSRQRSTYTRRIKQHAGVFQRLICAFYDRDAFSVFMASPVPWDLARGMTAIVAGHARLTWPLWWRFHLFLVICRLQRHVQLAPRVQIETVSAPSEMKPTSGDVYHCPR